MNEYRSVHGLMWPEVGNTHASVYISGPRSHQNPSNETLPYPLMTLHCLSEASGSNLGTATGSLPSRPLPIHCSQTMLRGLATGASEW
jgi:hypothetical protein